VDAQSVGHGVVSGGEFVKKTLPGMPFFQMLEKRDMTLEIDFVLR
jgi:hypothetical protein